MVLAQGNADLAGLGRGPGGGARLRRGLAAGLLGALTLAGCERASNLDWDLRGRNGFSTTEAARAAAPRPAPDPRGVIAYPGYQVAVAQSGETVRQMAGRLGVDAGDLARQNALDPGASLRGGELLVLPGSGAGVGSAPISVSPLAPVAGATPAPGGAAGPEPLRHTVRRGETAFTIARLYNLPARTVAEWNGLPADMSVREGQVLLIPAPQSISDASAATASAAPLPIVAAPTVPATTATPLPPPVAAPIAAAPVAPPPAATTTPGQGTPTPVPPSASAPLPQSNPAPAGQGAATGATPPPVADMAAQRTQGARLAMPLQGRVIRAYQRGRMDGIGIGAPAGSEVRAAAAGTVAAITRDTDQVPILVVRHENNLLTVYANIDNIRVERGARVSAGQVLAVVRSGDPSFLHFEVREGFESVDPMPYLQ